MSFTADASQAIEWTVRFLALYTLFDAAEKISRTREFKDDGVLSWKNLRSSKYFTSRPPAMIKLADIVFEYHVWQIILLLRLACAAVLLVLPQQRILAGIALFTLFVTGALANFRMGPFRAETENRLALMITGALALRCLAPTLLITQATLWFIALQSCLTYVTAGVVKLFNRQWRNGMAIFDIFNSSSLAGFKGAAFFLMKNQVIGKFLTWCTLGFECAFPLVLVVGKTFFILFLIAGALFHFAIAITLRLNKFFWVWIATYPAILYIAQQ